MLSVAIDYRENAEVLAQCLREKGHAVSIEVLSVGDYRVNDLLLIERKTLPDFARSVLNGRLFRQANRLAYQNMAVCLILEGTTKDLKDIHISRSAFQGALTTISLIYRIPVLRSMNQQETASLLEIAADQLTRHRTGSLKRPGYRPKRARKQKLYFLQGLPGIGPDKAEHLLNHFGSIERIIEAEIDDLQEVPTIGPNTARRLYQIVREQPAHYGSQNKELFPI